MESWTADTTMFSAEPERDLAEFLIETPPEVPPEVLQQRPACVNVLFRVAMMSGMQMNLNATLQVLLGQVREIVSFDKALVYFWDKNEERTLLRTAYGVPDQEREPLVMQNAVDSWIGRYGVPLLLADGSHRDSDLTLQRLGCRSLLAVPVLVSNRVMGSIQLFAGAESAFTAQDGRLMWLLMRIAENLLTREYSNEGLIHFAFTDHLTGLKTRGYFEQQLEMEIKRAQRKDEKFVLLMLDIDHFKPLNDSYGHHIGDKALRKVAAVLMEDMREVDTVARYGGEEFVIILPDTGEEEGLAVAQRIRTEVESLRLRVATEGPPYPLTISIGLAVFDADAQTKRDLVRGADSALYSAKANGRNRVITCSAVMREKQVW